ncbi:MAG: hypothetical protein EXR99_00480 [Gemmataceae bacterium]|nr:hypothetical protein [Gemmataceae bacterium]
MNALKLAVAVLVVSSFTWESSYSQETQPSAPGAGQGSALNDSEAVDGVTPYSKATLSQWILYPRDQGSCGPLGRHGPIVLETYFRTGVNFPIGGGIYNEVLNAGWNVGGGGRSLFFNPEATKAWVIDLGISNVHYNSSDRSPQVSLFNLPYLDRSGQFGFGVNRSITIPALDLGLISLNQTFVNMSGGKEYYLLGDAFCQDRQWRIGGDVGGRYGTCKGEFVGFPNISNTIGAIFLTLHSDLIIPWGKCNLFGGVRLEWDYTWSDILQRQNNSDLASFGLLFNGGLQF